MRRKRRNHLPGFKAKVALTAIKGDKTLAELSEQFDVHQNQSTTTRRAGGIGIGAVRIPDRAPPTPPGMRVRTGRFEKLRS
jgi:transposase